MSWVNDSGQRNLRNRCYTYAGLDWYPRIEYPEPSVELTYIKDASQPVGDAGDDYIGFDRFGRTVDMNWRKTTDGTALDHIQYGYNRASNRSWRKNLATSGQDEAYRYDGLYQLRDFARGNLNINCTLVGAIPEAEEEFTYDPTGNWQAYVRKSDGTTDLDQTRANNKDNQITQIDGSSGGIAHDLAGNATQMPPDASGDWDKSLTITWDAWNRIVKLEDGGAEVGAYEYDGLYRRTTKTVSGVTRHAYYSNRWKPLEERLDASTDAERQYFWGARPNHRDELILRDRKTGAPPILDERLYCAMDYFNPTAVFDKLGVVQERYGFSGFGTQRIMAPDFGARTASSFAVEIGFQGQFLDEETGWYDYGYRYYSPEIGRWTTRDPIEEDGSLTLYAFVTNAPIQSADFLGLKKVNCVKIWFGKVTMIGAKFSPKEIDVSDAKDVGLNAAQATLCLMACVVLEDNYNRMQQKGEPARDTCPADKECKQTAEHKVAGGAFEEDTSGPNGGDEKMKVGVVVASHGTIKGQESPDPLKRGFDRPDPKCTCEFETTGATVRQYCCE